MAKLDTLIALAQTVNKNKVKNIQVIGNNPNSMSKMDIFYRALAEGKYQSEEEAAEDLYGAGPGHAAYRKLKERMEVRLGNTVFFIDTNQPSFTEYQKAYYTCYKAATTTQLLLGKHARTPAIKLAEKTIKHAIRYELTNIVLQLSRDLRLHYGGLTGNKKKYKYYNDIVQHYSKLLDAELLAEEYYTQIITNFINSTATKPEMIKLSEKYANELEAIKQKHHSYRFNLIYYNIKAMQYELANDYKKTISVARDALRFFEQKKHMATKNALNIFLFKIIGAKIYLKQFEDIEDYINQCIQLTPEGSFNWFLTYDRFMIYLFHSGQFNRAHQIFSQISNQPQFKTQPNRGTENWIIHEAFLNYFIVEGKITSDVLATKQKFRISKFLNQVPTSSKDKRGSNITILLLQILFLLQQKKYGDIVGRMEALKSYSHRYLRKGDTLRSSCFIKMLLCVPAASFHKKAVLRKAEKYWKKLQDVPLEKANQSVELEIVPYEMLWEFVLEGLDEKWH